MSAALVEVTQAARDDHKRGCQGREYTCTCGHDDAIADAIQSLTTRIAELEAESERLRDGLREIDGAHLGDQPAASGGTEYDWAMRHISRLRAIARATLTEPSDDL